MITRASIVEKLSDDFYRIRIPYLDKTQSSSLNISPLQCAYVSKQISGNINFQNGETVFVDFEEDNQDKPVIIGCMSSENNTSTIDLELNSLTVTNSANFSSDITIGNISYENIKQLEKTTNNIQEQIDGFNSSLKEYLIFLQKLKENLDKNDSNVLLQENQLLSIESNLDLLSKTFGSESDTSNDTIFGKLNNLKRRIDESETKVGDISKTANVSEGIQDYQSRISYIQGTTPTVNAEENSQHEQTIEEQENHENTYTPIQSTEFDKLLAALRSKFPHGKYWNHAPTEGNLSYNGVNNQDGWTETPCPKHKNCGTKTQTCNGYAPNSYETSWQCMGYANKCGYDMTGYDPENSSKWKKTTNSDDLKSLKKGDIVRYKNDGHSIYIIGIDGSSVIYTDCNSDGHCVIKWDKKIEKDTLSKTFSYIRISPKDFSHSRLRS